MTTKTDATRECAEDNYVAWLRYVNGTIRVCDSDSPGAFKVYRHPKHFPPSVPVSDVRWMIQQLREYAMDDQERPPTDADILVLADEFEALIAEAT